jgi:hypothetical protein
MRAFPEFGPQKARDFIAALYCGLLASRWLRPPTRPEGVGEAVEEAVAAEAGEEAARAAA